jgi:preprotein translocase subunit SecG
MIKTIFTCLLLCLTFLSHAQNAEMAERMREDGKIYVVIAVIGIIFAAIVIFLVTIERRLKKLEEEDKNKLKETT